MWILIEVLWGCFSDLFVDHSESVCESRWLLLVDPFVDPSGSFLNLGGSVCGPWWIPLCILGCPGGGSQLILVEPGDGFLWIRLRILLDP